MNKVYHGTSLGWLGIEGFRIPFKPFGEGGYPLNRFIYLCSEVEGAKNAANTSFVRTTMRIKSGEILLADFNFNDVVYPPGKYVYEVEISDSAKIIDLFEKKIGLTNFSRISKSLLVLGSQNDEGKLKYVISVVLSIFYILKMKLTAKNIGEWIRESIAAISDLSGSDRQVVDILRSANFDLVQNIHSGESDGYGIVYALIIHGEGSQSRCAGKPSFLEKL